MQEPKGWHSRGYLPHFDSPEIIQHIIFRTANSLPVKLLGQLDSNPARRRTQVDALLDACPAERPLADPRCARIVQDTLLFFDKARYRLLGWCVMPNHVHAVIEQIAGHGLGAIVKSWKMASTRQINAVRRSTGPFWAADYFDRFVRNEDQLASALDYVENNPVKAGLVGRRDDWSFSSAFAGR